MKLSKRLKYIEQMVEDDYTHIWDCCCDHGFLGNSLLAKQAAETIHFVDIVPELIYDIEKKLQQFYPNSTTNWKTHCLDVAKLPLDEYQGKHLIIIAGIGGDLMTRMVDAINQKHPDVEIDFLLCPVHRQYALRQKLIELDFSLKDEILLEEKRRFYEAILVSTFSSKHSKISAVGEKIWQAETVRETETINKYLDKTIQHYQQMQKGNAFDMDDIIKAYEKIIT